MLFKWFSNVQMVFNLPLDVNDECGQNLFLVLYDDHAAISIRVWLVQFTVEIPGNLVFVSLVCFPEHHSNQEQILAVNFGDVRELREVDPVAMSKSLTLGQQKALVHYRVEVGICSMEDKPTDKTIYDFEFYTEHNLPLFHRNPLGLEDLKRRVVARRC